MNAPGIDKPFTIAKTFHADDSDDLDPAVRRILGRRAERKRLGAYHPVSGDAVYDLIVRFLETRCPGATVTNVGRLGGGASKEQFGFEIAGGHSMAGRYVLRMEPRQSISESDRRLEFELIDALRHAVPAPEPVWIDEDGASFGQPAAIFRFVGGVTKPKDGAGGVTGLGTVIGDRLRPVLKPQFLDHLVSIHAHDWRATPIASLAVPDADPRQAALRQVNWWSRVWREDCTQSVPIVALAERWMRANLPAASEIVVVHGDYRTGNYLFDDDTGQMTAILDWELGHLGDYHEDLAWTIQPLFGTVENGRLLAGGLFEREEFLAAYTARTGRSIDPATLHFYEVFSAYKCIVITLATGIKAVRDHHNHQEVLLSWLAPIAHIFASELGDLLSRSPAR